MIVKIDYEQLAGTALLVYSDGDYTEAFMIVRVNKFNLEEAIQKAYENKWIVGLEYTGNPYDIDITDFKGVNVYAVYTAVNFEEEGIATFEEAMKAINPALKVVVRTSADYSNMQVVKTLCMKYPNVSFMGGTFLKLPDCRFGEVDNSNLPKRILERNTDIVISDACSIVDIVQGDDIEYIFGNVPYVVKKRDNKPKDKVVKTEKLVKVVEEKKEDKGTEASVKVTKPKKEKPKKQVGASFATSEGLNCF